MEAGTFWRRFELSWSVNRLLLGTEYWIFRASLPFFWPCIIVYQYDETNVMQFSLNLLRIKGPLHVSSFTCSSSGGAPQTVLGILRAYNVSFNKLNEKFITLVSWYWFRARFQACAVEWYRSLFFWDVTQYRSVFAYRPFGTICKSHVPGSFSPRRKK
jgi:hypothetical protein